MGCLRELGPPRSSSKSQVIVWIPPSSGPWRGSGTGKCSDDRGRTARGVTSGFLRREWNLIAHTRRFRSTSIFRSRRIAVPVGFREDLISAVNFDRRDTQPRRRVQGLLTEFSKTRQIDADSAGPHRSTLPFRTRNRRGTERPNMYVWLTALMISQSPAAPRNPRTRRLCIPWTSSRNRIRTTTVGPITGRGGAGWGSRRSSRSALWPIRTVRDPIACESNSTAVGQVSTVLRFRSTRGSAISWRRR